jgi:hypothetical protein
VSFTFSCTHDTFNNANTVFVRSRLRRSTSQYIIYSTYIQIQFRAETIVRHRNANFQPLPGHEPIKANTCTINDVTEIAKDTMIQDQLGVASPMRVKFSSPQPFISLSFYLFFYRMHALPHTGCSHLFIIHQSTQFGSRIIRMCLWGFHQRGIFHGD